MRILFFVTLFFFSACAPKYTDSFPCRDDGMPKQSVVLLPMQVLHNAKIPERAAKDLDKWIREELKSEGMVFMPREAPDKSLLEKDFFHEQYDQNTTPYKDGTCIISTELIEYKKDPYRKIRTGVSEVEPKDAVVLSVAIRCKIVRATHQGIEPVRQEIIKKRLIVVEEAFQDGKKSQYELEEVYKAIAKDIARLIERVSYTRPVV